MDTSMITYEQKEWTTVYASFPQVNELCCVICKTDFIEVHESLLKSNFYWQTLKCRLLIHLVSDVIASPILGTENFIFVIMHKLFFQTGKLQTILTYLKLVYQGVRPITIELYKKCLLYTIQAKIAPSWNKVGQYFLQGKEFYNSIETIRALKLDILIQKKEMCLLLQAEKVKIPYIKLEDYIPAPIVSQFLADPKGYIDLSRYKLPFVHVLPSTKKGKLLSVSKEIPTRCHFKDYDQLRRHWKNMYGYFLPKNKDGIQYYEIKFLIHRSDIFTYPNLCVAIGSLDIIPNREKEFTITCFLSDMLAKLPKICGNQLQISKKTLNVNLPSNGSLGGEELDTHLQKTSSPNSNLQLASSAKYVDELKRHTNNTSTSLKTQLARIHQIHNTSFHKSMSINLNNADVKGNQNDIQYLSGTQISTMQTTMGDCLEASTSGNSDVNCIRSQEKGISKYFRVQKPHSVINKRELTQEGKQKHLILNKKLLKTKSDENNNVPLQKMGQNIDIEAIAKNNKLHQVKNNILSTWLKEHSIPHSSKTKKTELIKKVQCHIKNMQVLKQFRL